jgi:hypothetical protein
MDHVIVLEDDSVVLLISASFLVGQTVLVGEIVVACLQFFHQLNQLKELQLKELKELNQLKEPTKPAHKIKK